MLGNCEALFATAQVYSTRKDCLGTNSILLIELYQHVSCISWVEQLYQHVILLLWVYIGRLLFPFQLRVGHSPVWKVLTFLLFPDSVWTELSPSQEDELIWGLSKSAEIVLAVILQPLFLHLSVILKEAALILSDLRGEQCKEYQVVQL